MTKLQTQKLYTHPTFGVCRVMSFDKARGLVMVRWPEFSSSDAFFSLVAPETLKRYRGGK
jgi:hypothetical protein